MEGDEFGYSPDIGKFVTRNGVTYTEFGNTYVWDPSAVWRSVLMPYGSHENYADWTDEQRAQRFASHERECELYNKSIETEREARHALVVSAKSKLSIEEFDAVTQWAADELDPWRPE